MRQRYGVRAVLAGLTLSIGVVSVAQNRPAEFYFGGRIYLGMGESEALKALSSCCKLSPDRITDAQKANAAKIGRALSQFIVPKEQSPDQQSIKILGTISFDNGRVSAATRPLGEEAYLPWNEDALGFARTLERALSPLSGNAVSAAYISVQHNRLSNGEDETLSITFANGRGVRLRLIKLDKAPPNAPPETKEQATLEEFLETPSH